MITPAPQLVWVVVTQHTRSSSVLPFTASSTRKGAWKQFIKATCGLSEPREPHLEKLFAIVKRQRRRGDLSVQKAVIEVTR